MKRTLWEFRIHKDDVTLHAGFRYHQTGDQHEDIRIQYMGPRQIVFRPNSHELWVEDESGRIITTWPLDSEYCEVYPYWTEIPCLFEGHRWVFEFRRKIVEE